MFVKLIFQLIKPFHANLHFNNFQKYLYICTPKNEHQKFFFLFANEHHKYAEFYADFKPGK
jgi:hypothetical protein